MTTFLPDRSSAATSSGLAISGAYITASASSARISSTLLVAVTPSGSVPMMFADVPARLVRRVHPAADEFEVGVLKHALDGGDADAARRPLHDPQAHVISSETRTRSTPVYTTTHRERTRKLRFFSPVLERLDLSYMCSMMGAVAVVKLRQWRGVKPVAGPTGVATTTRFRTTPKDERVLDLVAEHLGRLRRADLVAVVRPEPLDADR